MNLKQSLLVLVGLVFVSRIAGMSGSTLADYQETMMRHLQASGAASQLGLPALTPAQKVATDNLFKAISERNLQGLRDAIAEGAYMVVHPFRQTTPLEAAAIRTDPCPADIEIVETLLKSKKANINERCVRNGAPVLWSLVNGITRKFGPGAFLYGKPLGEAEKVLVKILMAYGADPYIKSLGFPPTDVYRLLAVFEGDSRYKQSADARVYEALKDGLRKIITEGHIAYLEAVSAADEVRRVLPQVSMIPQSVCSLIEEYLCARVPEAKQAVAQSIESKQQTTATASVATAGVKRPREDLEAAQESPRPGKRACTEGARSSSGSTDAEDDVVMEKEASMSEVD